MKRNGEYLDAKKVWNGEVKCPSEILVFSSSSKGRRNANFEADDSRLVFCYDQ